MVDQVSNEVLAQKSRRVWTSLGIAFAYSPFLTQKEMLALQ